MNTGRTGMRPQAVLFDLDGTLSDSFADITTAINLTRADFGLVPVTLSEVRSRVGSGSAQLVRDMVPVPEEQFEQACTVYRAHYEAHLLDETHLYPGVTETLEHFGDRPLAVITNKGQAFSERILAGLGILDRFRMVLGGDSLPRRKPDPLPLLTALAEIQVPPQSAVMVGDGVHDVRAGRAAGVVTVSLTSGVGTRRELAALGPDHIIGRLAELRDLFS